MTGDTKGGAEGHDEELAQEDGHESKDGIDDETRRKKTMIKLLTVKLDKLVAKKDDACAPAFIAFTSFSERTYFQWKHSIKRLYGPT